MLELTVRLDRAINRLYQYTSTATASYMTVKRIMSKYHLIDDIHLRLEHFNPFRVIRNKYEQNVIIYTHM